MNNFPVGAQRKTNATISKLVTQASYSRAEVSVKLRAPGCCSTQHEVQDIGLGRAPH